jgi:ATP-binding protein involved in chromosome partitioning
MSYLVTAEGAEIDLFGRGGAESAAQRLGVPFLGALPLYVDLRVNSDAGTPEKNFDSNPGLSAALTRIVKKLAGQISLHNLKDSGPELNIR